MWGSGSNMGKGGNMSAGEDLIEYLSEGFCGDCKDVLEKRLQTLILNNPNGTFEGITIPNFERYGADFDRYEPPPPSPVMSWSSFHQNKNHGSSFITSSPSVSSATSSPPSKYKAVPKITRDDLSLPPDQSQEIRCSQVRKKKDFKVIETVNGKVVNTVQGLELHTKVFDTSEQRKIVDCVYDLQQMAIAGKFTRKTYLEPPKTMRGKGRITMQFGCCYNYAMDKFGNPPGIIRDEDVDPIPPMLKSMIKRLVRWSILPQSCIPDSCIVNIYNEGDCIPPHIDHHDFLRPFCTVSFLTEANIKFGSTLRIDSPGEFSGPLTVPLPVGSVLILQGNGADIAKHCVPAVPAKRISITFRKMDENKQPYRFIPDPDLQDIPLLIKSTPTRTPVPQLQSRHLQQSIIHVSQSSNGNSPSSFEKDDFPPLSGQNSGSKSSLRRSRVVR